MLSVRADEILTAVVHGARKEEPSTDVQLAAMQALYNSLSFIRENFEREVRTPISAFQPQLSGLPVTRISAGRAQLHHAGGMRGNAKSIRPSAGNGLRVSGADHDFILQQDGLLYGTCALWGRLFYVISVYF